MRAIRILSVTILLVGCSCQDISFIEDMFPALGNVIDDAFVVDDPGDGGDPEATQPPPPQVDLMYGDNVAETLDSGRGDLWTFSGEAGDVVTITMTSAAFDSFLALFAPSGDYLTCDDDSGGEYNASIIDFPLPGSGVYTINAMGLIPDRIGDYSLAISQTANGMMHPVASGGSLNIGDTKSGSLAVWTGDAWTFNGSMGDVVSVGSRSTDFDTVLSIHGPEMYRLAWDDDGLGNYNSLISGLTLPDSGRYTIVVRSFSDEAIGEYELGSAPGTEIPGWEVVPDADEAVIAFGETVQGNLTTTRGEQWTFHGSAGDSIEISTISEEFDGMLSLFGPSGEYLTFDDDGGTGDNATIDGYSLPLTGVYYVDVLSYGTGATGAYSLMLDYSSSRGVPSSVNSAMISYGSTVNQTLGAWVGDEWVFEGSAGDVITISMASGDFDAILDLYDAYLYRVAMDDDSGGDPNAQISSLELPVSGIYTIVARAFGPLQGGDYTLTLTN